MVNNMRFVCRCPRCLAVGAPALAKHPNQLRYFDELIKEQVRAVHKAAKR